jgi:hypothetical protein
MDQFLVGMFIGIVCGLLIVMAIRFVAPPSPPVMRDSRGRFTKAKGR